LNLNYLTKRKHLFKSRLLRNNVKPLYLRLGESGFFSLKMQRFEFVYMRFFKKLIRRRYLKKRMRFRVCRFWLFLRPNCILSCKSTNSRMGAGVGALVRVAIKLKSYTSFVEFQNYSSLFLRRIHEQTRFRIPLKFIFWQPK